MGPRSENRGYGSPRRRKPLRSLRLQWVHGPRTVVMRDSLPRKLSCRSRFNGSTVREPWLWTAAIASTFVNTRLQWVHGPRTVVMSMPARLDRKHDCRFNGSTVREPWLWTYRRLLSVPGLKLQWVHGPRTVVMFLELPGYANVDALQWVHGPRTVVMYIRLMESVALARASMGPRSENRGYVGGAEALACRGQRLQWVHGPRTVVMTVAATSPRPWRASMGPRSENRGYACAAPPSESGRAGFNGSTVREPWLCEQTATRHRTRPASMGPRSENRGYVLALIHMIENTKASMGPRSENRGYVWHDAITLSPDDELQWVHGPRTVVMGVHRRPGEGRWQMLQWVHGPRTVVMDPSGPDDGHDRLASMGPRSENRGYDRRDEIIFDRFSSFNGSTVREPWLCSKSIFITTQQVSFNGSTVREPWLWTAAPKTSSARCVASMGPRSENRGYGLDNTNVDAGVQHGFNGSTVREPWLCVVEGRCRRSASWLQWVHGPRTVVMGIGGNKGTGSSPSFNGSTVREPWLWPILREVIL